MFEEKDEGRKRRIREARARTRAEETRRAMLELLRNGPLGSAEVRAKLTEDATLSVVNYHLSVLVSDGEVVNEGGLYRLA
jgi:DNA-binding transcriptional ArsR family regulator